MTIEITIRNNYPEDQAEEKVVAVYRVNQAPPVCFIFPGKERNVTVWKDGGELTIKEMINHKVSIDDFLTLKN